MGIDFKSIIGNNWSEVKDCSHNHKVSSYSLDYNKVCQMP